MVATVKPPMIATAIGPKKALRVRGIIARIAAAAVSMMGRKRMTAESMTALVSLVFGATESSVYLSPAPLYHAAPLAFCCSHDHTAGSDLNSQ